MPSYDDLQRNYATAAAQSLPPITRDLTEQLGLSTDDEIKALGAGLARAFMAGVNAGEAEVMAQAAALGLQFNVHQLRAQDEDS